MAEPIAPNYQHQALYTIPSSMDAWRMGRLEIPAPSEFGEYVLTGVRPAGIELHHEVEVLDEHGNPLSNVWVIFGFGSGPNIHLQPSRDYWYGSPAVLKGNAQRTSLAGYVRHTFQQGGENIWIWDMDTPPHELRLPSPIVKSCNWIKAQFIHTGVKLTFQRRTVGIVPNVNRLQTLEARVAALEDALG